MNVLPLVIERGAIRLFVPFTMQYGCLVHGRLETAAGQALLDTGADMAMIPAELMPPGHVGWEDLEETGATIPTVKGPKPYRRWPCQVFVDGVEIGRVWKVWAPASGAQYPIVGMKDFAAHFDIGIAAGGSPPGWFYRHRPQGSESALIPASDALAQVDFDSLTLMDYGTEGTYRVGRPGQLPTWHKPQLTAPVERSTDTPRPNRAQRRARRR